MIYSDEFEQLWKIYPKRAGGNPKPRAFKAYSAILKQGHTHSDIKAGLERYATFCRETAAIGSPFVMQAATFFSSNSESWIEEWELPKSEVKESLIDKGRRLNIMARIGESMQEFERRISQAKG